MLVTKGINLLTCCQWIIHIEVHQSDSILSFYFRRLRYKNVLINLIYSSQSFNTTKKMIYNRFTSRRAPRLYDHRTVCFYLFNYFFFTLTVNFFNNYLYRVNAAYPSIWIISTWRFKLMSLTGWQTNLLSKDTQNVIHTRYNYSS